MRIGDIRQWATDRSTAADGPAAPEQGKSRALVAVARPEEWRLLATPHQQAAFLTQLLAAKDQHPQARARRRATPDEASTAYRRAAELTGR